MQACQAIGAANIRASLVGVFVKQEVSAFDWKVGGLNPPRDVS